MTAGRFFRTPKGLLILVLGVLVAAAAAGTGVALVTPGVVAAIATAMMIDAPLIRWRRGRWHVPDGALLSGLIVAMILSPHQPWYVAAVTSAVAILSKYPLRVRTANIFNPAAFALVATFYVFHTGQSWWGALPELSPFALALLIATGAFITHRVNKVQVVLAFLGSYYALITLTAFVGNPAHVAELYRAPDLHAALFFAFFMVTDPPTSPPKHRDQLIYGAIVGVTSYAAYALLGAVYFLLAGLLVANVWEAWRRNATARRPARSATSEPVLPRSGEFSQSLDRLSRGRSRSPIERGHQR
ncbi:MAG: putative rane protein [Gemmatimonadetes bacterium]|nr:putative rane protein [Gemmatimonadota bacterium]